MADVAQTLQPDIPVGAAPDLAHFERDGWLVWPGFWPPSHLQALTEHARALIRHVQGPAEGEGGVFSTRDHRHSETDWFLGSDREVRAFLEEEAVDADGRLLRPLAESINKLGHALHRLDDVFHRVALDPRLAWLARSLGQRQPQVQQSMLIVKQPGIGGEVRWHQDATYLYTDPPSVLAFWWALEDASVDNGCLWVQPGGHRGPLRERFVRERGPDGREQTRHVALDPPPASGANRTGEGALADALPLPVAAGSLVVMHGLLPHRSEANRSDRSRLAFTLHTVDAQAHDPGDNWIRAPGMALPRPSDGQTPR